MVLYLFMEDCKSSHKNSNSDSLVVTSHRRSSLGSTSALNVAFNDLKRRYLAQQSELTESNCHRIQMSSELAQSLSTIQMLERKIEQLQKSLQSKSFAYNNLEEVYKQTREHEESLIKHSEETQHLLEESLQKLHRCQIENEEIRKECHQLTKKLKSAVEDKAVLEKELETLQIPEIKISSIEEKLIYPEMKFTGGKSESESGLCVLKNLQRQVHHLNSENQTLRTNVHWLSKELKIAKMDKSTNRIRRYSDSLEEGKQNGRHCHANDDSCKDNFRNSYIHKLQKTIFTLKETLMHNNKIIKFLLSKKVSVNGDLKNGNFISRSDKVSTELDVKGKLSIMNHSDKLPGNKDSSKMTFCDKRTDGNICRFSNPSVSGTSTSEDICVSKILTQYTDIKLPPSLLENVQLLQTQTYLTSKTLPQYSQRTFDQHDCH